MKARNESLQPGRGCDPRPAYKCVANHPEMTGCRWGLGTQVGPHHDSAVEAACWLFQNGYEMRGEDICVKGADVVGIYKFFFPASL